MHMICLACRVHGPACLLPKSREPLRPRRTVGAPGLRQHQWCQPRRRRRPLSHLLQRPQDVFFTGQPDDRRLEAPRDQVALLKFQLAHQGHPVILRHVVCLPCSPCQPLEGLGIWFASGLFLRVVDLAVPRGNTRLMPGALGVGFYPS